MKLFLEKVFKLLLFVNSWQEVKTSYIGQILKATSNQYLNFFILFDLKYAVGKHSFPALYFLLLKYNLKQKPKQRHMWATVCPVVLVTWSKESETLQETIAISFMTTMGGIMSNQVTFNYQIYYWSDLNVLTATTSLGLWHNKED